MAAPPQKFKRKPNKPNKSRPATTSSISQPAVENAWSSTVLSAFSPDAQFFAFLSLAVDKHRLRILDTDTGRSIAEHIFNQARVTCFDWITYDTPSAGLLDGEKIPSKRRKVAGATGGMAQPSSLAGQGQMEWAITIGLSNGAVQIYSVKHCRIVKSLDDPTSKSAVLAISGNRFFAWTSSADGALRLWDIRDAVVVASSQKGRVQCCALAARPRTQESAMYVLAAHSTIRLLSLPTDASSDEDSDDEKIAEVCSFDGHASLVKSLVWERSSSSSTTFLSCAQDDRFVYLWRVPESNSKRGNLVASCALDSDVIQLDLSALPGRQVFLAVSSSGRFVLCSVPEDLKTRTGSTETSQVATLSPRSVINPPKLSSTRIVAATFLKNDPGKVRVALASGGVRITFENLEYLDQTGEFIPELSLSPNMPASSIEGSANAIIANKRYTEPSGLSVSTGSDSAHDPSFDVVADREVDGLLNADLAELSLGQRLAARSAEARTGHERGLLGQDTETANVDGRAGQSRSQSVHIPAHSLTRTLIQALHAGDTSLLEACLAHSDETVVHNTVARLPAQLAVPLLTACVERFGRGPRGNNIKGRGGGASAQRGLSLMKWVRAVLVIHSGHLMTMPDLIARLSHLHSTLATRLTLQERLLSLSGRLDLILAQVDLRSSHAPAPLEKMTKKRGKVAKEPLRYVEGESSEDEAKDEEMNVEIEEDDEGSVEDVELDEGSSDVASEEELDSEGEESDDDANLMDGSVDDDAEGKYDEESWEEDSD